VKTAACAWWPRPPTGTRSTEKRGDARNGPGHYRIAEQLLEHADAMLAEHVGAEGLAELLERQRIAVGMATAHAALAAAAGATLTAALDVPEAQEWRRAARTPVTDLGAP
jgi:hypothetical protein